MGQSSILISGATGLNGRALLQQLSSEGVGVRAMVRNVSQASDLAGDYVELIQGDYNDTASLRAALAGIDKAYIVTSVHRDALEWYEHFFTAAKDAGVKHIVKFSGLGSDVNSPSEIIRQHGESDAQLKASGMCYTILRPNSFFQNMLWQAQSIAATGLFYLPMGDARHSLVDVRDLAEATARVLSEDGHENREYDLTGPQSLSFFDVASTLSQELSKPVSYIPVSVEDAKAAMLENGMPGWDAHAVAELQGLLASGRYAEVVPDLENLLGRTPRAFGDFVHDYSSVFSAE